MSSGTASLLTAACIVVDLSPADIPVVTPVAASIDPVNAVPNSVPFFFYRKLGSPGFTRLGRSLQEILQNHIFKWLYLGFP